MIEYNVQRMPSPYDRPLPTSHRVGYSSRQTPRKPLAAKPPNMGLSGLGSSQDSNQQLQPQQQQQQRRQRPQVGANNDSRTSSFNAGLGISAPNAAGFATTGGNSGAGNSGAARNSGFSTNPQDKDPEVSYQDFNDPGSAFNAQSLGSNKRTFGQNFWGTGNTKLFGRDLSADPGDRPLHSDTGAGSQQQQQQQQYMAGPNSAPTLQNPSQGAMWNGPLGSNYDPYNVDMLNNKQAQLGNNGVNAAPEFSQQDDLPFNMFEL